MEFFKIFFILVFIMVIAGFVFTFAMMFSPKLRGKLMSRQIKAGKYMMDESKDDIKSISDDIAFATKDSVKTTVRAIKEGFKDSIYCKYCGNEIDSDSKYCKKCGKEQ